MSADSKLKTQNSKLERLVSALLAWFAANARDLPWRRTRDPYAIWVSEIMLQQTQVKTVIPYWERWMRELPTIESLAAAQPEKIHKLWEGLGYYTRVRNMQKAAQQIVAEHDGKFPDNFDAVLALPGIGRYTAGAICSIAFNQPTPILDGNVIRVLTRVFGIRENPKEKQTNTQLWQLAAELVSNSALRTVAGRSPAKAAPHSAFFCSHLNQSLMELGALICTPRQPKCEICPVKKLCIARRDNLAEELPNLGKRAAATERHSIAFVVEQRGKFLVRQRPAGVVNAHLWEFPNVELSSKSGSFAAACNALRLAPHTLAPLCTVRHSITRYRITLEAFRVSPGRLNSAKPKSKSRRRGTPPSEANEVWLSLEELEHLAFTSAHRKILAKLQGRD